MASRRQLILIARILMGVAFLFKTSLNIAGEEVYPGGSYTFPKFIPGFIPWNGSSKVDTLRIFRLLPDVIVLLLSGFPLSGHEFWIQRDGYLLNLSSEFPKASLCTPSFGFLFIPLSRSAVRSYTYHFGAISPSPFTKDLGS